MIKLHLGNSESKIEGLSVSQFAELRGLLSYTISAQANYFSGAHSNKRYLLSKRGEFPSGLTHQVQEFLADIPHELIDLRIRPKVSSGMHKLTLPYTPYPEQYEAVAKAIGADRGIIRAVTGFGKSISIALLVEALQVKTLIVVPNLELRNQLTDSFKQYFSSLSNITICNIGSPELKKTKDYQCLIIDEAHHSAAKTYRALNKKQWAGIYHRYFFTATPFRSRDEENILFESVAGQVIYEVSYQTAVEKGYIAPLEAFWVDLPHSGEELYGNYSSVYKKAVVNNQALNEAVANMLGNLCLNYLSTLCVVKEIEHGNNISQLSGAGFANGQSDDCSDLISWFAQDKLKALIGTHGVIGEGVDLKPCEYVLLPIPIKSKNLFMQVCGRAIRKYPGKDSGKIILIRNGAHSWFKKAFKEQVRILKEEFGISAVKLEI